MATAEANTAAIINLLNSEKIDLDITNIDCKQLLEIGPELIDILATPFFHSWLVERGIAGIISDRISYPNIAKTIRQLEINILQELTDSLISYFINFAEKDMIIECFQEGFVNQASSTLNIGTQPSFTMKMEHIVPIRLKRNQSLPKLGDGIILHETTNAWTLLFLDSVVTQENETVSDSWITPEARSEDADIFARVNYGKYTFHKVIIPKNLNRRIFLISPRTYAPRKQEAMAKLTALKAHVEKFFPVETQYKLSLRPMYFFPIIQKLYENSGSGLAGEAEFYTAKGNRVHVHSATVTSDLREDPYHIGGAANNSIPVKPYKLRFRWLDFVGRPELRLNGRSDMCDKPNVSLPVVRVIFDFKASTEAEFLKEPLSYVES